jgi:hypothetical protein
MYIHSSGFILCFIWDVPYKYKSQVSALLEYTFDMRRSMTDIELNLIESFNEW